MIARALVQNVAALNASFIVVEEIRAPKHFFWSGDFEVKKTEGPQVYTS